MEDIDRRSLGHEVIKSKYEKIRHGVNPADGKRSLHPVARMPGTALALALMTPNRVQQGHVTDNSSYHKNNNATHLEPMTIGALVEDTLVRDARTTLPPIGQDKNMHGYPTGRAYHRMQYNKGKPLNQWVMPGENYPGLAGYVTGLGFDNRSQQALIAGVIPNHRTGEQFWGLRKVWKDPNASTYVPDATYPRTSKGMSDQQNLGHLYRLGHLGGLGFNFMADTALFGGFGKGAASAKTSVAPATAVTAAAEAVGAQSAKGAVKQMLGKVPWGPTIAGLGAVADLYSVATSPNDLRRDIDVSKLPKALPVATGYGFYDKIPEEHQDKYFDFRKYPTVDTKEGQVHQPYTYNLQEGRRLLGDDWYHAARKYHITKAIKQLARKLPNDKNAWTQEHQRIAEAVRDLYNDHFDDGANFIPRDPNTWAPVYRNDKGVWQPIEQAQQ